jgi:probable rRNA maturation factor
MDEPPSSVVVFRRVPAGVRKAALERFARRLRDRLAGGAEFECLVTTDAELQRLNRAFRGQDYPTDVLSFPSDSPPFAKTTGKQDLSSPPQLLGSLAISYPRAAEQARRFGHSVEQEIQILMLHGILHLLGLDHETDRGRMARMESGWRRRLELPSGLIERARQ